MVRLYAVRSEMELDVAKVKHEMVEEAKRMKSEQPEVGVVVLERTNMPPYAAAIQKEVGLPILYI
jgi:hypothetical protein